MFADIVNPVSLKMNKKYTNIIEDGTTSVTELEDELWAEILAAQTPEMLADLKLLKKSAQSIKLVPREE